MLSEQHSLITSRRHPVLKSKKIMKRSLRSLVIIALPMKRLVLVSWFAMITLLLPSLASGQAELIRDINTTPDRAVNEYSELTDWNGNLYFVSEGKKLYIRKGNAATPVMLRSLSHISELT